MSLDPWLLGEDLTAITITPLTKEANGTLTPGVPYVLTDCILEADPSSDVDLEDIRPVNVFRRNEVPVGEGASMRIVCLQYSSGANVLTALQANNIRYYQVDWTQGAEVFQFRGVRRRFNPGVRNRGANPVTLELGPINEQNQPNLSGGVP